MTWPLTVTSFSGARCASKEIEVSSSSLLYQNSVLVGVIVVFWVMMMSSLPYLELIVYFLIFTGDLCCAMASRVSFFSAVQNIHLFKHCFPSGDCS